MLYIFHGPDTFSQVEAIEALKAQIAPDPGMAALNTTHLDGRSVGLVDLRHACDTIPFLGERRLVIVEGLLKRLTQDPDLKAGLMDYLPQLPETTWLVLSDAELCDDNHPLLRHADKLNAEVRAFAPLEGKALQAWITRRVQQYGGSITSSATALLAEMVPGDLHQLDQEIHKLVAYADEEAISPEMIRTLVHTEQETSIFTLVDALGRQDGRTAMRTLRHLLDQGQHPLYVLTMIVRQFRLMIQTKDLAARGETAERIAKVIHQHPYAVKKALRQSRLFTMEHLERIYKRLAELDWQIKTGQIEADLALDLLVAALSGRR